MSVFENGLFENNYSLLAPGPVNLHPEVRKVLALPMIHHRTPEFDQILARVLKNIKTVFQTEQPVYLLTATGSGGMEALLVNTVSPGDKVLAIVSGKFGERWGEMAQIFGAQVTTMEVPWGKAVDVAQVESFLSKNPDTRAVLCQACETSTAVAHPIKELGEAIHRFNETLFFVDGITAVGAYPLPMDEWHIDGIVAGSQKAFMLPTGMAFVSLSEKAWKYVDQAKTPRFYFDLRKEKTANAKGETFYSSNVAVVRALDVVLNLIQHQGLPQYFAEIHQRAEFTRHFGQLLGLTLYAGKNSSDSVTALQVPPDMDGQKIRSYLEETFKITIMGGQDQAKGKIIRIGHMGYIVHRELIHLVQALGLTLHHFDKNFISLEQVEKLTLDAQKYLEQRP